MGGEGGIRTLEELAPLTVFKTVAINRARPPLHGKSSGPVLYHLFFVIQTGAEMVGSVAVGAEEFKVSDPVGAASVSFGSVVDLQNGVVIFWAFLTCAATQLGNFFF